MASAENLLHEAQYAFQSISFGDTRENRKNAARAKSLAMRIIRRFPASSEASGAHAILRRLGEEAYSERFENSHNHQPQSEARHAHSLIKRPDVVSSRSQRQHQPQLEQLDWQQLIVRLLKLSKGVWVAVMFGGVFLLGILGPFLFLPLLALILFVGPFRHLVPVKSRRDMNKAIRRINAWLNAGGANRN